MSSNLTLAATMLSTVNPPLLSANASAQGFDIITS